MQAAVGREGNASLAGVSADSVHAQLRSILGGRYFAHSDRLSRLLRYLVERTLDDTGGHLKEYTIGLEVFDRGEEFDPQTDPIVRISLSRLRAKLKAYYESDGRDDALTFGLPKRSHSVTFRPRETPPAATSAWRAMLSWFGWKRTAFAASVAALITLVAGFAGVFRASGGSSHPNRSDGAVTSVAVLPFVNLSGDPDSEYLSDGLTEEIIHCLAQIDGLRVVSRTSAQQFKGKREDLTTTASQLGAEVVMEGTVRRAADRLRVTTRLVNGKDGYELDSHVYERGIADILGMEQQIGRQVALTVRGRSDIRLRQLTNSVAALEFYLKARDHAGRRSETELKKAIHYYERAIAADPDYAPANAALADAYLHLVQMHEAPPGEAMSRAKRAAQRAVKAGPSFAQAHSALGSVLALHDWDWAGAEGAFRKAIELDPDDAGIREAYALRCLLPQRRLDSALLEMQVAQGLDPLSPEIALGMGKVQHFRRDPGRAINTFLRTNSLEPGFEPAPLALAKSYIHSSLMDEAVTTLQKASAPTEAEARLAVLGYAHAMSNRPDRAREILARLQRLAQRRYISSYYFALIHTGLGEKPEALKWLEKAAAERSPLILYLPDNPSFDGLRAEPRFAAILRSAGLGTS